MAWIIAPLLSGVFSILHTNDIEAKTTILMATTPYNTTDQSISLLRSIPYKLENIITGKNTTKIIRLKCLFSSLFTIPTLRTITPMVISTIIGKTAATDTKKFSNNYLFPFTYTLLLVCIKTLTTTCKKNSPLRELCLAYYGAVKGIRTPMSRLTRT